VVIALLQEQQPPWVEVKTDAHWKKIGLHSHHGICLPLFSLRTKKSSGIGEFLDLIPLIHWCKKVQFDCIQLLPLNDSGNDPSPYNALSSCALDPVYLSLAALKSDGLEDFIPLTHSQRVLTREVKKQKLKWLRSYFEQEKNNPEYREFVKENPWLEIYALFKTLKEEFGGANWTDWPLDYHTPKPSHFETRRSALDFHCFLQFHCFKQMETVRQVATEQSVFIKGDIPILLSPDSADVWAHRALFQMDLAAGSPPDYYNPLGQKWGFPLFDWETMRQTGFTWWKQRLKVAEKLFHIYRIDHVVGFFRIWGIPQRKKPTEGFFVPADRSLWAAQGQELLEMMLDSSSLLPIAEDLGTIPKEVYPVLKELGICGTKVVRWQRRWETDKSYIPYNEYEPFSMTTLSTPDMAPLELWWKKFPAESVPFAEFKHWDYHPILTQKQRLEILRDAHHTTSYFHINLLQEYLALFPELVWPNPEEERINTPGTLLPTNWTYRFRPYLEEIISHEGLAAALKSIL